jgi:hypothetical protein
MNNYERLGTLTFRYARRELTGKEKKELMAWRRSRPEEENLFMNTTDPENIMVDVGAFLSFKEKGLQKLKDRYPDIWKDSPSRRYNRRFRIIGIAAVFLIGLSLIVFFLPR